MRAKKRLRVLTRARTRRRAAARTSLNGLPQTRSHAGWGSTPHAHAFPEGILLRLKDTSNRPLRLKCHI